LTGLLVTPPPGVDQARADAFAAAVADALVAAGWPPLVQIDAEFLQASLTLMAIQCELLDTIAAIDPTDAEAVADRILAAIPEAVAALEANGVTPDQAAVLEAMPGWYAAMFTAAADYLCPQHAEALDNAVANAARAQP
jgi:dihydropteroate synthase